MLRLMPAPVYVLLAAVQAVAGLGLLLLWRRGEIQSDTIPVVWAMGLFALFVAAVFYRFNWVHFTPQGRYFFPLLLPFGIATSAGLRAIFPSGRRGAMSAALAAGLLLLNVYLVVVVPSRG
jgi:hypothetical protein